MVDLIFGEEGAIKIADNLVDSYKNTTGLFIMKVDGFNGGVNFAPLLSPVRSDFIWPLNEPSFECFWPLDIGRHEGESGVDVSGVKSGVSGAKEFDIFGELSGHS